MNYARQYNLQRATSKFSACRKQQIIFDSTDHLYSPKQLRNGGVLLTLRAFGIVI